MGFAADCNGRKVPGDLCKSYFEYLARMVVVVSSCVFPVVGLVNTDGNLKCVTRK